EPRSHGEQVNRQGAKAPRHPWSPQRDAGHGEEEIARRRRAAILLCAACFHGVLASWRLTACLRASAPPRLRASAPLRLCVPVLAKHSRQQWSNLERPSSGDRTCSAEFASPSSCWPAPCSSSPSPAPIPPRHPTAPLRCCRKP